VAGVVLGAGFAWAAVHVMGYSAPALFLTVIVCFLAARALRLEHDGALAVAITVILVVGPSVSVEAVETRFLGVVLGSVVALATSYFTRPGTPHGRALTEVVDQAERTSILLADIGITLSSAGGRVNGVVARAWLETAEDILARTVEIRQDAQDAVDGARWSPLFARDEAQAVLDQVRITEGTALTVAGMCRNLLLASDGGRGIPDELAMPLSDVLLATAGAISEQSEVALVSPAEALADHTGPVGEVARTRREAVAAVRQIDDTSPMLLSGSLLRDSETIADILSGR